MTVSSDSNPSTTVILVRHAESTWNAAARWQGQADPPLSEQGRAQARRVAQRLAQEPITTLYSSDLRRALETATIIADQMGLTPRLEPRLRELDVGAWSGLTRQQLQDTYPKEFQAWRDLEPIRAGGGETFAEMQQRAVAALDEILAQHAGETVAAVTHGGIIYALRGHVLGLSMAETFRGLPPNRNTAITVIRYAGGTNSGGEIVLLMDAMHLDEAGDQR